MSLTTKAFAKPSTVTVLQTLAFVCFAIATSPAGAVVHFGHGVFIGGHDFSHQTYDRRHRAVITLYDRPVRGAGCVTRGDGQGGSVKRCRLQTIRRGAR